MSSPLLGNFQQNCGVFPVPPLPEYLGDWRSLPFEDFRKPWEHFAPFLESLGYVLAHSPGYDIFPEMEMTPTKPAKDPFHPSDEESFVYRTFWPQWGHLRVQGFFQPMSTAYLARDQYGRNVYIKAIPSTSTELETILHLSTEPLRADPRNHTIPHVKSITAGEWTLVVQAYWSLHWDYPPFDSVGVRLEMGRQVLEGLAFMHENGVGHGDIHCGNILWNHDDSRNPHAPNNAPFQSTFDFRFAFIDFGSAVRFAPGASSCFIRANHIPPQTFAAPEQSLDKPYDVLRSDVYNVGRVLAHELEESRKRNSQSAVDTLAYVPEYTLLISQMTQVDPSERPFAWEALKIVESIISDWNSK